ncbi:CLUMA_CG019155, isoform A [Clunio marinus]|uniref:CLUMA_CG019155, isoform A n=1 Tax=Clunio marinus TaxID=568069 RepID=A0A1J1J1D0_9DIPT|nr:CLUMA_CG019155, isoform A [Clunio marinus]
MKMFLTYDDVFSVDIVEYFFPVNKTYETTSWVHNKAH